MGFKLTDLHLTLTYSKGQCNVMHILDCEYIENVYKKKLLLPSNSKSCMELLHLSMAYFRDQGQGHAHFTSNYLKNDDR